MVRQRTNLPNNPDKDKQGMDRGPSGPAMRGGPSGPSGPAMRKNPDRSSVRRANESKNLQQWIKVLKSKQ